MSPVRPSMLGMIAFQAPNRGAEGTEAVKGGFALLDSTHALESQARRAQSTAAWFSRPRGKGFETPKDEEAMLIGQRIRQLREQKGLSQGDLQQSSGLPRAYISRVEHGHTVASLRTLQKFAKGLDVPLYQLFYEGEEPLPTPHLTPRRTLEQLAREPGAGGLEAQFVLKLRRLMGRMTESERRFLLEVTRKLAAR